MGFPAHNERRVVYVFGASSGIGEATARLFAAEGYPVIAGARSKEKLDSIVADITKAGGEAHALSVDVLDEKSITTFLAEAEKLVGPPEIIVSGAGVLEAGISWEMTPSDFAAQIDIHLLAQQRVMHYVLPGMIERKVGDFIAIGSDASHTSRPRMGGYVAAKAGLQNLTEQAQKELEGTGVRMTIVRPGPVLTGMGLNFDESTTVAVVEDFQKHGLARHHGFCTPDQLAHGVLAAATLSRGAFITELEIQPEAPIAK